MEEQGGGTRREKWRNGSIKEDGAAESTGVGGIWKQGLGGREREKLEHPVTCEGSIDADRPSLD
jgi:hypothetical protein